jgi:hypothetical protein
MRCRAGASSVLAVVLTRLAGAGCSTKASMPPSFLVSGTVTVDGSPLVEGVITFDPLDGQGGVYGGRIQDGKYAVEVAARAKKR